MIDWNELIVGVVGGLLTFILGWLVNWLVKNGKPIIWTLIVNFAKGLVEISVGDVNQTYVDAKKAGLEDGVWTKEEKKEAFMLALKKFVSLAGPLLIKLLQDIWGANYEENLKSMVEAEVRKQKGPFLEVGELITEPEPVEPV